MVRWCVLAALGLATFGVALRLSAEEAPNPRVHYLDEYTAAAIQHYPSLRAAKADIAVAHARLNEAKLSPFFQFRGNAAFFVRPGAQGTPIFSPDSQLPLSNRWGPGVEVNAEGGIPIYTFGKYRAGKTAARAGIKAAEQERERTLSQVVYDVRRAYFGTQLSLDLQSMISEGKGKLAKAVDKLEARLNADDPRAKQTDYWRLLSTLSEIESRESEALRLEASARAALEILSGIKPAIVPECRLEPVESEVIALSQHLDRALANRPEIEQLQAAKSARDANLVVKRAGYLPDIILALAASFASTPIVTDINNPFIIDRGNFRGAFAGLVAKWELDFAGTNARVKAAKAEIESLKAKTEEAHDGIELEVIALFEHLQDAKRRMNSWARAERETRKWFVSAGQGYEVGTMSAKDLEDSIEGYFSARSKHLMAIAEYNLAIAGLEQATGMPLVDLKGWRPPGCEE
ncbi:MAG: TolC family protein [Myxococcales bacterium]|nr:TolC family protein [Myxococcales bacterium]MDH3484312.1 TolC family protein [Myxococcales bacterium]